MKTNLLSTLMRSLVTAVALLFGIAAYAETFVVDGIRYKTYLGSDVEVVTRTSSTYSDYSGDIVIPDTVTCRGVSYAVLKIGDYAFNGSDVTSVLLPETIELIGIQVFQNSKSMRSCNIPSKVRYLGEASFRGCSSLQSVTIPKKLTRLSAGTFEDCASLQKVVIPKNVEEIEYSSSISNGCFSGCTSLKEVVIEDSDNPLGFWFLGSSNPVDADEIFYGCPIESVYIGRNIPAGGGVLFNGFSSIKSITFGAKVTTISSSAFRNCTGITEVVIPDNITQLEGYAFDGCSSLTTMHIGHGVTLLPYGLFSNCTSLENVFVGNGVKNIEPLVFAGCSSLRKVFIGNKLQTIGLNVFSDCKNLDVVICSTDLQKFEATNTSPTVRFLVPIQTPLLESYTTGLIAKTDETYEYNGKVPAFKSPLSDVTLVPVTNTANVNVGSYNEPVTVSISIDTWSSTFTANAQYTVTPAPLTVIANDVRRGYGEANPELSATILGFKNDEDESVLTRKPTLSTTATPNSLPGTYPIIPMLAEAQNYTFTYERGVLTVTKAANTLTWNQSFAALAVGESVAVDYEIEHAVSDPDFSGYDPDIIEFKRSGDKWLVVAKQPGTTDLTLSFAGNDLYDRSNTISKTITVKRPAAIPAESVVLNKTSITLGLGTFETLSAVVMPDNATDKTVLWTSQNNAVAEVSSDGIVMAKGVGSTYIKASCGDVSATCAVTVSAVSVSALYLDRQMLSLRVGDVHTLTATIVPEAAADKSVMWVSSDTDVATVTDGEVKAIKSGAALITASCEGVFATCTVTVDHPTVIDIVVEPGSDHGDIFADGLTLLVGESKTVRVSALPTTAHPVLSWSTSNAGIATVVDGVVTGKSEGSAIVTISAGDFSKKFIVSVERHEQTITWEQEIDDIRAGRVVELTAVASSGLPVEYSVIFGDATVSASTLTVNSSGAVTLKAEQSGNERYLPAEPVIKNFDIPTDTDLTLTNEDNIDLQGNELVIADGLYSLFNLQGILIKQGTAPARITLQPNTTYILRVGNKSFKFMTR